MTLSVLGGYSCPDSSAAATNVNTMLVCDMNADSAPTPAALTMLHEK